MKWVLATGVILLLGLGSAVGQSRNATTMAAQGRALMSELGCAVCHTELKLDTSLRERTPDLSSAGLRYRPAWLFEFLQNPAKVRQHLGRARMPGFHLSEKEALALVAFLETQQTIPGQWPPLPEDIAKPAAASTAPATHEQVRGELANGLLCLTCHKFDGRGGVLGVELATVGNRLRPEWVRHYLVSPASFGVSPAVMPPQFYQVSADGKSFRETTPGAAGRVVRLASLLDSVNTPSRDAMERKYAGAKAASPGADAVLGEKLFTAFNCASCHRHHSIQPRPKSVAPDLTREGLRVNATWLMNYLKRPHAIRPFGHHPGDGSRMPDFRLSDEEAEAISAFLLAQREGTNGWLAEFRPQPLSAFSQNKAKLLLNEKLSCLGCHRLDGLGGRIGPDLSGAGVRLQPAYLHGIIQNPRSVAPHSIMPRVPLTQETARLIADYLMSRTNSPSAVLYLSPAEHHLLPFAETPVGMAKARHTYLTHCAACHGASGQGDGFNAGFLNAKPTAHANADYLSKRPDDTLYDGIHSGGYILNKSHFMPPWGETFAPQEVRDLVGYLRTLCQCQAPPWSLDGSKQP